MKTQKVEEAIEKVIGSLDLKGITQEEMFGKEGIGQISAESIYRWIFNEKRYLIEYLRRYHKDSVYKKEVVIRQKEEKR